jgi:hypothetical protein
MTDEKLKAIEDKLDLLLDLISKHPLFKDALAPILAEKALINFTAEVVAREAAWSEAVIRFCTQTIIAHTERASVLEDGFRRTIRMLPKSSAPSYAISLIMGAQNHLDLRQLEMLRGEHLPEIIQDVLATSPAFKEDIVKRFGEKPNAEAEIENFKNTLYVNESRN